MPDTNPAPLAPPADARTQGSQLHSRAATFTPSTWDPEARTVELIFTTGADVERRDWWTGQRFIERLDVTPDAVDLSRLNAGGPLLNAHQSWDLGTQIGVVERAWIANGEGRALVRLSGREDVAPIVQDIADGILRNVSVGYWVNAWAVQEASANSAEIRTATRWTPGEISLVPVPADPGAQLRAATPSTRAAPAAPTQEARMAEPTTEPGGQQAAPIETRAAPPAAPPAPAAATLADLEAIAERSGLGPDWVLASLRGNVTLDAARDLAIDALAGRRAPATSGTTVQVTQDESVNRREGMVGWLLHRAAPGQHPLQGPAEHFRGLSLLDLARESLEAANVRTRGWSPFDVARAALNLPGSRAGGTTSDFPNLLGNYQSKRLIAAYGVAMRGFTMWARRRDLPDFKTASTIELGMAPALAQIEEQADITYGQLGENGETWKLARYAKNVPLSYVAIVNDDLGGFDRVGTAFGNAAANLENSIIYGILATNANMADGNALFSAAHANTGSGAASVDNFATIRTLIMRQKDASGQPIMVMPSVIICPVELDQKFRALFSPNVVPTVQTTSGDAVNPYRGTVQIDTSQALTDANDWFVTVPNGSGYEAVEYGYEMGSAGPSIATYTDSDTDGLVFSCRHSFGGKAVSWRTIARSAN